MHNPAYRWVVHIKIELGHMDWVLHTRFFMPYINYLVLTRAWHYGNKCSYFKCNQCKWCTLI